MQMYVLYTHITIELEQVKSEHNIELINFQSKQNVQSNELTYANDCICRQQLKELAAEKISCNLSE